MKKLKLQTLQFGAKEVLTRDQLKKIMGGSGSGSGSGAGQCYYSCTYTLNGSTQTVHSWGSACSSSTECSVTNTSCYSYGKDSRVDVYCAAR